MAIPQRSNLLADRVLLILVALFFAFFPDQASQSSAFHAHDGLLPERSQFAGFSKKFSELGKSTKDLLLHSGSGFRCFAVDRSGIVAPISCPRKPKVPVKA